MRSSLNYTQKNKWLFPVFIGGMLLCWFLAFSQTYDAIALNYKLKQEAAKANDLSFNPTYIKRKQAALSQILKGYEVTEHWKDQLWIKSSSIAAKANLGVNYTISGITAEVDSTNVGMVQSLAFYGGFQQLVRLTDSLEREKGIGKISALQILAPKVDVANEKSGKEELRIDFKGIDLK